MGMSDKIEAFINELLKDDTVTSSNQDEAAEVI